MIRHAVLLAFLHVFFFVRLAAQSLPDDCLQLITVTSQDWDKITAILTRYQRADARSAWQQEGPSYRVVTGRNGMAWDARQPFQPQDKKAPFKREGDGKSPAGIFPLLYAYGYDAPQRQWKFPYVQVNEQTLCIDDPKSRYYNQIINRDTVARPDWNSHEQMRRQDELYRFGIVVGYNMSPVEAGKGSCIFMHLSAGTPQKPRGTAGCTAMQRKEILQILDWLDASKKPVLLQMPVAEWRAIRRKLNLP